MLVLSAVYHDRAARHLLDVENYGVLMERTIRFLSDYGKISRTCHLDSYILKQIRRIVFPAAHEADLRNSCYNDDSVPTAAGFSRPDSPPDTYAGV